MTLFINIYLVSAQQEDVNIPDLEELSLTSEQKNILKEQLELTKKIREDLKRNLSVEQKKILTNKNITRSERAKLLQKSLSARQLNHLKRNQQLLQDKRIRFRKTITKKQRIRFRKFVRDKKIRDKRRLVRRLRQLIRDNLDR